MSSIPFTKMHGIGNDYIYIDCCAQAISAEVDLPALARAMSDRHCGIGADGLILVMPPDSPFRNSGGGGGDVRMRMFNADGSESEMCGNGIRCVCKFAHDRSISRANPMRIETGAGVLSLSYVVNDEGAVDCVTVDMGIPVLEAADIPVDLAPPHRGPLIDFPLHKCLTIAAFSDWSERCGLDPRMTCVSMGNPHVILFCDDVASVPLETIGPFLETHFIFPNRTNVHFVQVNQRDDITMRTWERGSGITLACGTGAAACCVAGARTDRTERSITAHLPGGDLELEWDEATNHVFKTGPAVEVFSGDWPNPRSTPRSTPGPPRLIPPPRASARQVAIPDDNHDRRCENG